MLQLEQDSYLNVKDPFPGIASGLLISYPCSLRKISEMSASLYFNKEKKGKKEKHAIKIPWAKDIFPIHT